jgi:uncharacterized membrane protein
MWHHKLTSSPQSWHEASATIEWSFKGEVFMRLNFFFKVCGLLVQARSAGAVRTLLWAASGAGT